ncbi:hypothetical protein EDB85DRAFT_1885408 [Lactarius pseudohatsudake]|nr:hypothetical protein EDB85DRAFT_1885408 [Lactarius pseudohatsudake]
MEEGKERVLSPSLSGDESPNFGCRMDEDFRGVEQVTKKGGKGDASHGREKRIAKDAGKENDIVECETESLHTMCTSKVVRDSKCSVPGANGVVGVYCNWASVEVKWGSKVKKENGDKEEGEWRQGV